MPQTVRWFIRTSAIYLVLTFLAGAIFLYYNWLFGPLPRPWVVIHLHAGLVGWLVNIVIGVGLWMFPLNKEAFPESGGRYTLLLARLCYFGLNLGLPVRLISELIFSYTHNRLLGALMVLSGIPQFVAVAIFLYIVWKRVRLIEGLKANL
ncbi:MAG: hypothetical protein ONB44_21925 [candidate division KSB1 bacterium]|nr:hypothetical protein [candidate division KSB1 bacterium]MDZ7304796.1 hypothetical protein [candidate division KSB1 bacterium]MDZ7313858.1 hypothetical protein [candidate division KSB1 bacterium]